METELPRIPAPPEVEQINPPDQEMLRMQFGKLKPKDKDDKNKKKKAQKKQPKKDDKNKAKPIKWADGPPRYVKSTYHHLHEAEQQMAENNAHSSSSLSVDSVMLLLCETVI